MLFARAALSPQPTLRLHLAILPIPRVSYDTPIAREGAARQDSSGAAAQEVGTVGRLPPDRQTSPLIRTSQAPVQTFGLALQGLGKRVSKEKGLLRCRHLILESSQSKKSRDEESDPFREKGKENMGSWQGWEGLSLNRDEGQSRET